MNKNVAVKNILLPSRDLLSKTDLLDRHLLITHSIKDMQEEQTTGENSTENPGSMVESDDMEQQTLARKPTKELGLRQSAIVTEEAVEESYEQD